MTEAIVEKHEFLTVRELADLLRIKERKVYDLASSGEVPCSRATGKLLFPADEIRAWIERAKSGGSAETIERPAIFLGSHDPLLDWAIRQSRSGLASFFDGSLDGLARFRAGEGIATGLHVYDSESDSWNIPAARAAASGQNAVLIRFATRQRGLVVRPDGPKIAALEDLTGLRVAPRQEESGTATLFRELARKHRLDTSKVTLSEVARTEDEAVQMVRFGDADATFGLQAVADTYGLGFVPIAEERFDLLVERKAWFEPQLQAFDRFCRSNAFRQRAMSHGGYDVSDYGIVAWNA